MTFRTHESYIRRRDKWRSDQISIDCSSYLEAKLYPHNCGKCDSEVVAAIERYAVSGDLLEFEGLIEVARTSGKLRYPLRET